MALRVQKQRSIFKWSTGNRKLITPEAYKWKSMNLQIEREVDRRPGMLIMGSLPVTSAPVGVPVLTRDKSFLKLWGANSSLDSQERFITLFKRARHWTPLSTIWILHTSSCVISLWSFLIYYPLLNCPLPSDSSVQMLYPFLILPFYMSRPSHPLLPLYLFYLFMLY